MLGSLMDGFVGIGQKLRNPDELKRTSKLIDESNPNRTKIERGIHMKHFGALIAEMSVLDMMFQQSKPLKKRSSI